MVSTKTGSPLWTVMDLYQTNSFQRHHKHGDRSLPIFGTHTDL